MSQVLLVLQTLSATQFCAHARDAAISLTRAGHACKPLDRSLGQHHSPPTVWLSPAVLFLRSALRASSSSSYIASQSPPVASANSVHAFAISVLDICDFTEGIWYASPSLPSSMSASNFSLVSLTGTTASFDSRSSSASRFARAVLISSSVFGKASTRPTHDSRTSGPSVSQCACKAAGVLYAECGSVVTLAHHSFKIELEPARRQLVLLALVVVVVVLFRLLTCKRRS
jgi:hypothetical protein